MDYLFICNMSSDYISKISLGSFKEEKITLCNGAGKVGPHGICSWGSDLIIANSFGNSISKIDIVEGAEVGNYYIGSHCNDVDTFCNEAYVACGESNTITIFDLISNKIVEEIPSGNHPHSIIVNKKNAFVATTNMESDSITLLNCLNKDFIKEIKVGPYPTKAVFSKDGKYLYVCESNLGSDKRGSIGIVSLSNFSIIDRIYAGKSPVDMFYDCGVCYVSNFNEGTVSIIYLEDKEEVKKIDIGGMPRGIVKKGRYLYVGDNYGSLLIKYDIYKERKKVITIGVEPTGMTVV